MKTPFSGATVRLVTLSLVMLPGLGGLWPARAATLAEALNTPAMTWSQVGDLCWSVATGVTHDGVAAGASGIISHSQSSGISTTVQGPGTLSFWWKVSSESGYDALSFRLDGAEQTGKISGDVNWTQASYTIPDGPHTVAFVYAKDGSISSGSDKGWVDEVVYAPSLGVALDNLTVTWSGEGNAEWHGQTSVTHDGVDAAASGAIGHSQYSALKTTVTGPVTVAFWWKVSSESGCDWLSFRIDGAEQAGKIAGEVGWQYQTYAVPSGSHTISWVYSKDGSVVSGADKAWVDQVSIGNPPAITTQPASLTRNQGQSATFTVVASGSSLGYQWRKDGANISGATSASYAIASVQLADAAAYGVVVSNAFGSVTSDSAVLTVLATPSIVTQPASITRNQGEAAAFTVAATGGNLSYYWRKDGVAIAGANNATYTIANCQLTNAGTYSVIVSNSVGTATSSGAVLTVVVPPTITQQPAGERFWWARAPR